MKKKITIEFTSKELRHLYFQACRSFLTHKPNQRDTPHPEGGYHPSFFEPVNKTMEWLLKQEKTPKAQYYMYWCNTMAEAKLLVAAWGLKEYEILCDTRDDDITYVVWCQKNFTKRK
jgi:hypothetical protein